jgi:tetratricopeptide (TPR) repeat protein
MGGHIKFDTFENGIFEKYGLLLDRAVALDPSNAKAHILKAEVFERSSNFDDQFRELEKARSLQTTDPWLQIGYGRYYSNVDKLDSSYEAYSNVMRHRPGTTASERKAYVRALRELSDFRVGTERRQDSLRKYASMAMAARHPADAWTPQSYAESFIDLQLFEDAIVYAREALKTMNFGAGRLTLAAALYARAAQLDMAQRQREDLEPLLLEANGFGFSRAAILEYLIERRGIGDSLRVLEPSLNKLVK